MGDTTKSVNIIREELKPSELLAQLAEEGAELTHAALKLRRALDKTNPTPVTCEQAYKNIREELADILVCVMALELDREPLSILQTAIEKTHRWADRLNNKKEAEG